MGIARLLLDTNALLWALLSPDDLSEATFERLRDPDTQLLVSSVSAWEIAIKHALGKLEGAEQVAIGFNSHLGRLQADVLVITPEHALRVGALPRHHRDPFDRMLIAQSQLEHVPIVTSDALFSSYKVLSASEADELAQYEEIDDYLSHLNRVVRNLQSA